MLDARCWIERGIQHPDTSGATDEVNPYQQIRIGAMPDRAPHEPKATDEVNGISGAYSDF